MPRVTVNLSDTEAAKIDKGRGLAASVAAAVNAALRGPAKPAKARKPAKKASAPRKPKKAAKRPAKATKKSSGAKLTKAAFLARMAAGRKKAEKSRKRGGLGKNR